MIIVSIDQLSESQLADIALAIQNRWDMPAFVKMHEIIAMDEDIEDAPGTLTQPLDMENFESGLSVILGNLELLSAFSLERSGKSKFRLRLVDPSKMPKWIEEKTNSGQPQGVYACPHCVTPETMILGDNKQISDYSVGDTVMGQSGLTNVTQTFARHYEGELIEIKANGMLPIVTTQDHPILSSFGFTSEGKGGKRRGKILLSKVNWTAAKDLVPKKFNTDGNYVVVPIIKGSFYSYEANLSRFIIKKMPHHRGYRESFPIEEDTSWLLGLFVAEGSVSRAVRFSLNKNEVEIRNRIEEIARRIGYLASTEYSTKSNSMMVTINSRVLARAFDSWCGHRAPNKKIPDFILFHSDERILRSFLHGYETGDSYENINRLRGHKIYRMCVTASPTLAQQLQLAYCRLGIWASIFVTKPAGEESIMGRRCHVHPRHVISFPLKPNMRFQKVRFLEEKVLCPIRRISRVAYVGEVHNLGTGDNTYLVSNAIVHNCGKWFNSEFELNLHTKLHYIL